MIREDLIEELCKKNLDLAKQIRVERGMGRGRSSDEAYSFIITGLKLLFPKLNNNQLGDSITDDDCDAEFDAIFLSKKEKTIFLFDFKRKEEFRYDDVKLFKDNTKLYLFQPNQTLEGLAGAVKKKLKQARKFISRDWKVKIFFIRKGVKEPKTEVRGLIRSLKNSYPAVKSYGFLNVNSLIDEALNIKSEQNNYPWKIKITPGNNEPDSPADIIIIKKRKAGRIRSMIARIKLADIVKLQKYFIENKLNLFDANVRTFQKNKPLSNKILDSIKYFPESFDILHNGLTFSCIKIEKLDDQKYTVINPQVINGCQTINTLYDKYKNRLNDVNIKKASILCRFYALEPSMIEGVCEATNTQLKIDLWDLRSNDEIQKIIEKALSVRGIDYKRKKTGRKKERVLITDLAQWIYSCKFGKPAEAKDKKSKLFYVLLNEDRPKPPYDKIFNEKVSLETIVTICDIAFFVKHKIKKIPKKKRKFEKHADLHFIAAIFKLESKKWTLDYRFGRVRRIIKDTIKRLRSKYGEELSLNKIFTKKEETWRLIERKLDSL